MRRTPAGPIVLVGIMGAGKTTVGRLLAERLGFAFVDLDDCIERAQGKSVQQIFTEKGEAGFRELEADATRRMAAGPDSVVGTGGGWMARPELSGFWPGAIRIWLRVSPGQAIARLAGELSTRPLLAVPNPEQALRELVAQRLMHYQFAELWVDTEERSPPEIVDEIANRLSADCSTGASGGLFGQVERQAPVGHCRIADQGEDTGAVPGR
ncbi:MAG: shikimate kinase [Gemmatimonadota bacterium]